MKKSWVKKAFVCEIVTLFIIMGIGPSTGGTFQGEKLIIKEMASQCVSNWREFVHQDYFSNLTINVTTDKTVYKRFEPVNVVISVTNNGDEDVTITFPYCNLLADFNISYVGLCYRDSYNKILLPMIVDVVIPSGETRELLRGICYQFAKYWITLTISTW